MLKYFCLLIMFGFSINSVRGQDLEQVLLDDLSTIVVDSNIKVILIAAGVNSLAYEKSSVANGFKYKHKNGRLNLFKDESSMHDEAGEIAVYVYFKGFAELIANNSCIVQSLSVIKHPEFRIIATGNANVDIRLDNRTVNIHTSGNARVVARGRVINEKTECEGSSIFRGEDLICQTAIINVRGTAQLYVNADKEIKGRAAAGTEIYYRGDPARIKINGSSTYTSSAALFKLVKID